MYISENCQWMPYGTNPELDKQVDSDNWSVRHAVAKQGYGLDMLINDKEWLIRALVAHQGYGLDKLVNDKVSDVREEVARQGYGLDKLVNDVSANVRIAVAEQGYGLEKLINDANGWVREKVAKQGYGLDKLINDKGRVRCAVTDYLEEHNLTIRQWIVQNSDKCVLEHNEEEVTKDFIYKIDESNKLEIQTQYDSIDEFFCATISDDVKMNTLIICSIDTKLPIFKIEKIKNETIAYKFIVDITNEQGDNFMVQTLIQSKEQLDNLIQQTIDALNLYPQFCKYTDDLENCL